MSTTTKSLYVPSNTDTFVIDRVKRKRFRSHCKAFGAKLIEGHSKGHCLILLSFPSLILHAKILSQS
ncbi:hypothetical protein P3L10_017103 [Capsicum annuum]